MQLDRERVLEELSAFMAGLPQFDDTKEHPEHLTKAFEACIPLEFRAGDVIVRQNDFGNSFFIIWTGAVDVLVTNASGAGEKVATLQPGQMFGELSLLAGAPRSATVTAAGTCRVVEIYRNGFERLVRYSSKFKQRMDELYDQRGKETHLMRVPLFSHLGDASFKLLLQKTKLRIYNKGEQLFEQGEEIDAFYLIKDGYIRLSQKLGGEEMIQAYVAEGHCFGQEGMIRPARWEQNGVAATWVEAIKISRGDFQDLIQSSPDTFARVLTGAGVIGAQAAAGLGGSGVGKTSLLAVIPQPSAAPAAKDFGKTNILAIRPIVEQGYVHAKSMLVMDMELCVRCGNCVRACETTHGGITRLVRRGITIARRKDPKKEGSRQFLQVPTSCLHCKDPECMIGCPTGAITRDLQREVFIQDPLCIGCGNCAARCPWGNIAMFPLANKEEKEVMGVTKIVEQLAVKCDLCRGRESSACVYNCPTGACIRIDPAEYFEELKLMGIMPVKRA